MARRGAWSVFRTPREGKLQKKSGQCVFLHARNKSGKKKKRAEKTKSGEEKEESGRTQKGTLDWVSSSLVGALRPPRNPFLSFSSSLPIFSLFFFFCSFIFLFSRAPSAPGVAGPGLAPAETQRRTRRLQLQRRERKKLACCADTVEDDYKMAKLKSIAQEDTCTKTLFSETLLVKE